MIAVVVAVVVAAGAGSTSFEPLCGNFIAGGGQFSDGCGTCDEDSAARWEPAAVTFHFDRDIAPDALGVSTARFAQDIQISLDAWNAVPSSSLAVSDGGDVVTRSWNDSIPGGINGEHVVFWAVDDAEWSNSTGFSPSGGALGVTTHGYLCDNNGDGRREPYQDADVILNGAPGLTASLSSYNDVCGGRPCPSSTTVLMHELGHALGLGHPCSLCSDSLLSATGIINHEQPLPDDVLSLNALYGAPRGLGTSCGGGGDCDSGLCASSVLASETLSYCTTTCAAGCGAGFACDGASGNCVLAGTSEAFFPAVGDACAFTCDDDCFGPGQPHVLAAGCNACLELGGSPVCVKGCSKATGDGCDLANEFCNGVGTGDDQGQCKPRRGEGGLCADDSFCIAGLTCVGNACHSGCDPANPSTCAPGQTCSDDGGGFTCHGLLAGSPCAQVNDCAGGLTCTGFDVGAFFCFVDCPSGNECAAGETCAVDAGQTLCFTVRHVGEECSEFNAFCANAATCTATNGLAPICSRTCDLAAGTGCDPGEACVDVGGGGLCLNDGPGVVGDLCDTTDDCAAALLCDASVCRDRCDLGLPCSFGATCTNIGTGSVCAGGGGEGEGAVGEGEGSVGEGEGAVGEGEGEGEGEGGDLGHDTDCRCGASSSSRDAPLFTIAALLIGVLRGGRGASGRAPSRRT